MESPGFTPNGVGLPCGCWDGAWWGTEPPPRCAMHSTRVVNAGTWWPLLGGTTTLQPLPPARISDEDVERIARRVAELLKAPA